MISLPFSTTNLLNCNRTCCPVFSQISITNLPWPTLQWSILSLSFLTSSLRYLPQPLRMFKFRVSTAMFFFWNLVSVEIFVTCYMLFTIANLFDFTLFNAKIGIISKVWLGLTFWKVKNYLLIVQMNLSQIPCFCGAPNTRMMQHV